MSACHDHNSDIGSAYASDDDDFECAPNDSVESSNVIKKFVLDKLSMIKNHNYKFKNVFRLAKFVRCKLHLQKTPKKKGYDKFLTTDEKRYTRRSKYE